MILSRVKRPKPGCLKMSTGRASLSTVALLCLGLPRKKHGRFVVSSAKFLAVQ